MESIKVPILPGSRLELDWTLLLYNVVILRHKLLISDKTNHFGSKSNIDKKGLVASKDIKSGTRVIQYIGKIISNIITNILLLKRAIMF